MVVVVLYVVVTGCVVLFLVVLLLVASVSGMQGSWVAVGEVAGCFLGLALP